MSSTAFGHLKMMIVEDNQHMRTLLRALLNSVGVHQITEVNNGAAALEILREKRCDLILSDMTMKPMDGLEFCRLVRTGKDSHNPFVPIIMVTGHTERHLVMAARDAGVTEFIAKPITPQNLFSRIAEIIERPRPFIRCGNYVGPDRRRKNLQNYAGPWRREDDLKDLQVQ